MSTDFTVGRAFEHCANAIYSVSTYLAVELVHFRNGPDKKEREMTDIELFARKVVGELGFVALVVASVIETLVRAILILPYLVVGYCVPQEQKELLNCLTKFTISGAVFSAENVFNCFTALIENIRNPEKLDYDQLMPSILEYNKHQDQLLEGLVGLEE